MMMINDAFYLIGQMFAFSRKLQMCMADVPIRFCTHHKQTHIYGLRQHLQMELRTK